MNLPLLREVRDAVASDPHFDMSRASRCVAGTCNRIVHGERFNTEYMGLDCAALFRVARESMEITEQQADGLFYPHLWPRHVRHLGDRDGALYLIDGMLLAGELRCDKSKGSVICVEPELAGQGTKAA